MNTPWVTVPLTLLICSAGAQADFYLHPFENQHENEHDLRLVFQPGFYQTSNNFDATGALQVPTGLNKYDRVQTDISASYGLIKRLSLFGRLSWARAQLDSALTDKAGTTFGFGDNQLGATFRIYDFKSDDKPNGITIDLQAQADFPLYSNTNLIGPSLGDGTFDTTGGIFLTVPIFRNNGSSLLVHGGGGFTYRSGNYSSAIPWSLKLAYVPIDSGFYFSGQTFGFQSLRNDPRANTITNTTPTIQIAPGAGGSFFAGGVNPSILTLRGELGYQFGSDVGANFFVAQSLWGQAAPNGFFGGLELKTHLGNHQHLDDARLSPKDYGRSNQGFVNYGHEAKVTRVSDRLNSVKIDKGSQDGILMGEVFDVFLVKKDGNIGEAVARGKVTSVQPNESALTIDEYFKEIWIDEGFIAKHPVQ
ncbi:hypothetical protein WDW37_17860 [Bdellovibrionota bacterium FG-1]